MKEMKVTLNVYNDQDEIIKTVSAEPVKFKFGAIRSLMELLQIEDTATTADLLKTVYNAWNELTKILNKCFPEMNNEDWDNVELNELIPATLSILRYSFDELLTIPRDEKNA